MSVAFELVSVPDRLNVLPVVLSWICAVAGSTVPAGPATVIVPAGTRPPVGTLGLKENESLTTPGVSAVTVTALSSVICCGAVSE